MRSYAALGRLLLEVFVEVANHATYGSARAALGLGAHGYSAVSTVSLTRTALRYDASEAGLYFEAINNCHEAPCVGLRIVLNG
jgi:hypothetical protein